MSLRDTLKAQQARPATGKTKVDQLLAENPNDAQEILEAMLDPEIQHVTILRFLKETYGFGGSDASLRRFRETFGQLVQERSK